MSPGVEAEFDVIVIGAGPAGEVVAARLADQGRAVAIVEDDLVGGECSFYACMPSKALLRPAQALAEVRRVPGAAELVHGYGPDIAAVLARRDEVIHDLDDAQAVSWLDDRGITLIRGHGRLDGERRVLVGDAVYAAREAVIIASGSTEVIPPIPGLREATPWAPRDATTASEVPARVIVLGGGVVGVELAQAYSTLGAAVTVIEAAERLLAGEEPFAGQQVADALDDSGVDVRLAVSAEAVRRDGERMTVELDDGESIDGDALVVAVGRRPLTDDLGLETVGLTPGDPITVEDTLRVPGKPWLYAIGDVNARSMLTHAGKYQAHVAARVIAGEPARATSDVRGFAPRVVYTEPQVAAVGMTLQSARDQELNVRAYDVPSSATAGASFHGRGTPGTSRLVVDEDRGVIVGATFTGVDVSEWVHAATIAIVGEIPVDRLRDAIPAFPTRTEVWLKLLDRRDHDLAAGRADAHARSAT